MMAHQYNPRHPFYQALIERAASECSSSGSWQSTTTGCGNSSCNSLGTLSSQGSIFSDSGDSQSGTRRTSRGWPPFPADPDLDIRGSCREWTSYQSSLGSDPEEEEEHSNHRADRAPPRGRARQPQSTQPDRDRAASARQQAVDDIRTWGVHLHNSFRAQNPHRPQQRDLDTLTQRHWCRLGLQCSSPSSSGTAVSSRTEITWTSWVSAIPSPRCSWRVSTSASRQAWSCPQEKERLLVTGRGDCSGLHSAVSS